MKRHLLKSHRRLLFTAPAVLSLLAAVAYTAIAAPDGICSAGIAVPPTTWLDKPVADDCAGAACVTGKQFLLVGGAQDASGIRRAWFELCPEGAFSCLQQWSQAGGGWEAIGDNIPAAATPGAPGEWQTTWDSTTVLDGFYFIRICAEDNDGDTNCLDGRADQPLTDQSGGQYLNPYGDAHWVYVNNRFEISLYAGWNLVSSPLLPYDTDIADVLYHLIALDSVESVWAYEATRPDGRQWLHWRPNSVGPANTLLNWVGGQGYWVRMKTAGTLEIIGTWKSFEDGDPPPGYPVVKGWNMIGYTHWGRPTASFFPASLAEDYLANIISPIPGAGDGVQALVKYSALAGLYEAVQYWDRMELGKGYWLSADMAGLIQP